MNENGFATLKYMFIHLLIFLFKNIIVKWLLEFSIRNISNKKQKELELLKQKRDNLKEKIREVSSINEYVKFTKIERQINNLNDEIKRREAINENNNINNNISDMNIFQKCINSILNSYLFKFFMFFINIYEYFLFKNTYLKVNYEENKNNIIANYYYDEKKDEEYSLIPISRILICETILLDALLNFVKNIF